MHAINSTYSDHYWVAADYKPHPTYWWSPECKIRTGNRNFSQAAMNGNCIITQFCQQYTFKAYSVSEIVSLNHAETTELTRTDRKNQPTETEWKIVLLTYYERSYEVCINGNLRTSSLKLYLIFLYISSPRDEKSTEISAGAGLSRPTSNITSFDV